MRKDASKSEGETPVQRSNLPPEEVVKSEAAALNALFEAYQRAAVDSGRKVSQASFGADNDIGVQGMVWQYINGKKPLNLEAAIKFALGMGVKIEAFSPRLARLAIRAAQAAREHDVLVEDGQGCGVAVVEMKKIPPETTKESVAAYLSFEPKVVENLHKLPLKWRGRAEQAVVSVIQDYRRATKEGITTQKYFNSEAGEPRSNLVHASHYMDTSTRGRPRKKKSEGDKP